MKLTDNLQENTLVWEKAGFQLPLYNRDKAGEETRKNPQWIHFGAGNIFRAFPAAVHQSLLDKGLVKTGIIVAEAFDYEIIDKAYKPYNDLSVLIVLKANGTIEKKVIGSVVESLKADSSSVDWLRLQEIFTSPSLQMASFTITEKGYSLKNAQGCFSADVEHDFENGPARPKNIMAKLASLCLLRFNKGAHPLAMVSMDNCSHNGTKLFEAVHAIAEKWVENGFCPKSFISYLENPETVSFPWSMIDKITPRPDDDVKAQLERDGFEDTSIIITDKNTYTAPFVNAEEAQYLVIEDAFPNGRPPLDKGGVIFTSRDTVDKVERMKVCTCLNPLHTSLAVYGCLLGYTSIHKEMHDKELTSLIHKIGYDEGLPVVVNPGIIKPEDFIHEVITVRLPNPFMPDTPQRIACDTSQKLPIRFGQTIKAYMNSVDLDVKSLFFIPLVFAGWLRYLMGLDDQGVSFTPSPDPLLAEVQKFTAGISLGDTGPFHDKLKGLLSDEKIFGVNLYDAGLGEKVESLFTELIAGKGAVRNTLVKYLS